MFKLSKTGKIASFIRFPNIFFKLCRVPIQQTFLKLETKSFAIIACGDAIDET